MAEFSEGRLTEDAPIDGERSRRIAEIVNAALEVPPAERAAFLDAVCGGEGALRREAEALLAADRTAEGFAAPPPPSRSLIGSTLSHYRIVEHLGAGGMSEVYLAEDEKLGRRVALKVLPRELAASPERLARFRREARTVAALNHPNIVTLHSTEDAQGLYFLTMELLEGGTLRERIRPGGLAADELLRLALPLADAVAAAHAKGITHRDLKPANVMISGDDRVKVVDFGLAKVSAEGAEDREGSTSLTVDGRILGTVAYMSPEQVVGHPVDCRSDVFSLGIVLYELATGEHPFAAPSRAEFMSKILRDAPVPAAERNPRLPRRLDEILDRCLEKDPDLRYPDARALLEDLKSLQSGSAVAPAVFRPRRLGLAVAAGLLLATLLAVALVRTERFNNSTPAPAPPQTTAAAVPARTAVAVLHFQNLTGDPQLDWLRAGLTEMLVTDLSQSPGLEVLGTDRLHQILTDLDVDNGPMSFDMVQKVARRAAVRQVIRGTYVRVGRNVLISFQIEDASNGEILGSDRVQGPGDERLLSLVDALVAAVHRKLDVAPPASAPLTLQDVTTSSVEAWRLYTEALGLHYQAKDSEAIPLLERAVELDPAFALALADLGTFHGNLGHQGLSRTYMGRAVEQAERLPVDQRSLIQGRYYAEKWGTYSRAVESFRETLRLYPNRDSPRNNLAILEAFLERYDRAAQEYETLLAQGTGFAPTTVSAANVQAALGRFEQGHRLLLDLAARQPDSWIAQVGLGWHLTQWGKLDEAAPALERAAALRPGDVSVGQGEWRLAVLREDWPQAERAARDLAGLDDPYARWRGALSLARNAQFRGAFDEALSHLAAAARAFPQPEAFTAMAHCWTADLLLDRSAAARALAEAQRAQKLAPGDWPELQGMFLAALAQQELGRPGAADALLAELKRRAARNPNAVEERQILRLEGRLALARGNPAGAVASLRKAASLLPPRGVEIHWHVQPDHVPVWYDLGRAELAAGRQEQAAKWFAKVAASGAEHIEFPVAYVRSRELLKRTPG
jgi:tetratricopeptide (TPR) repeat protein